MAAPSGLNSYEEERRQRVLRNTQRLAELGLLQNPLSGAAEAQQRAEKRQRRSEAAAGSGSGGSGSEHLVPLRQSRRQRGEAPENAGRGYGSNRELHSSYSSPAPHNDCARSIAKQWKLDLVALDSGGARDPAVDAHNLMRVRSMSERALQTRIWKIKRVEKLFSFIKVLEACDMESLAAEARAALADMTGGQEDAALSG